MGPRGLQLRSEPARTGRALGGLVFLDDNDPRHGGTLPRSSQAGAWWPRRCRSRRTADTFRLGRHGPRRRCRRSRRSRSSSPVSSHRCGTERTSWVWPSPDEARLPPLRVGLVFQDPLAPVPSEDECHGAEPILTPGRGGTAVVRVAARLDPDPDAGRDRGAFTPAASPAALARSARSPRSRGARLAARAAAAGGPTPPECPRGCRRRAADRGAAH